MKRERLNIVALAAIDTEYYLLAIILVININPYHLIEIRVDVQITP